ncbi:hypothetical protein BD626DRAFT_506660, partial [Schizophyllum amplum]
MSTVKAERVREKSKVANFVSKSLIIPTSSRFHPLLHVPPSPASASRHHKSAYHRAPRPML